MMAEFFELGNKMTATKKILWWLVLGCLTVSVSWSQEPHRRAPAKKKEPFREARRDSIREAVKNDSLGLVANKSQIMNAMDGFEEDLTTVQPSPGRVDTLFVAKPGGLQKAPTSTAPKKSKGGVAFWSLVTAGAALAITWRVLDQTVFDEDRKKNGADALEDLPKPPDRP